MPPSQQGRGWGLGPLGSPPPTSRRRSSGPPHRRWRSRARRRPRNTELTCPYWNVNSDFHAVHSCHDRVYDNFWVYDGRADGYSAVVKWHTDTGGSGECRNANGYGTWVRCNYNLKENKANGTRNYVHWQEWRYDADEWG